MARISKTAGLPQVVQEGLNRRSRDMEKAEITENSVRNRIGAEHESRLFKVIQGYSKRDFIFWKSDGSRVTRKHPSTKRPSSREASKSNIQRRLEPMALKLCAVCTPDSECSSNGGRRPPLQGTWLSRQIRISSRDA